MLTTKLLFSLLLYATIAAQPDPEAIPIGRGRSRGHHHRTASEEHLRQLEQYEAQRQAYKKAANAAQDQYYNNYFDRMKEYAAQVYTRRYNQLLQQQVAERERFLSTMRQFGVADRDIPSTVAEAPEERPKSPFGDLRPVPKHLREPRADPPDAVGDPPNVIEPQPPSHTAPRPENVDVHRKAVALEALCSRFLPTVRKLCFGEKTAKEYVKRCAAYFHDCRSFLPRTDPLYNIAYAFNSNVGLNLGTVEVNGIPYYPINEEGSIGVGRVANVPFGSWGGGYSENLGVRDYWSQTMEVGANWYEGKYGYKSGWSVPLVQSLGVEGDTHALVSVPIKQGDLGKPIGVDVGGGVGPYYQQNQHVGVDYMNGQVGTNFGVGVPFAGVGVNTGVGVSFPSINDIVG
ncbi:hypothetical protein ANCCEY_06646 [Ancylostoma ceylanicum]|uniref:Uncharacterized protein n=2 Tax=Ancylostoma TaxID=29169 RepID=A0A0D6LSY2_9BILA|nr:hypothetical protein ANCCEY_06646 [Ancylostoma ceylanicum]